MDYFLIWMILIFVMVFIVSLNSKKISFSDDFFKQQKKVIFFSFWLLLGILLIITGIFFLLFSSGWGVLFTLIGIFLVLYYLILGKEDRQKLNNMYKKEEQEQLYRDELIKEKAKLQAKKEINKSLKS